MNGKTDMKPLLRQSGLSLIEIMVALVISVFLLGGIIQVYLGNKSTYGFTDAIARIQENGRFALDTITSDVRMAGFWGCVPVQSDNNSHIQNHLNLANDANNLYDFLGSSAIKATANDGINNSDTLTLRGAKAGQSPFMEDFSSPGSGAIKVKSSVSFKANAIVLITNCFTADIFQADSASEDLSTNTTTLTHTTSGADPGNINLNPCSGEDIHCLLDDAESPFYTNNAAAFDMQVVKYYIGTSGSNSLEPALYRDVNGAPEELIEGVEQMQLMFGIDTDVIPDDYPNQYVTSDLVPDMSRVKAIRVALVVRSDATGLAEANQTYQIFGTDVTATDSRLRQVFTSTITLRN